MAKRKFGKVNRTSVLEAKPKVRRYVLWDERLAGFALRVTPAGVKTYVLKYRNADGQQRWYTIGQDPEVTIDKATELAEIALAEIRAGRDPHAEKAARRVAGATVAELCDRYLTDYAEVHKKPSSVAEDRRMVEVYVKPKLGSKLVKLVNEQEVRDLLRGMRATPYMANRVWALLSKVFAVAEAWKMRRRGTNPCRDVDRYPEKARTRRLSAEEVARLGAALRDCEKAVNPAERVSPTVALAVRLLLLTGCRESEILGLRWEWLDLEHGFIHFPDSKTGEKVVPLGAPALQLLVDLKRIEGYPWVIPGRRRGKPLTDLRPGWGRLIARANLPNLRPHDLRHAFASVGAVGGESLLIIGAVLGHVDTETTKKYAHLSVDPLRAAADRIAGTLAAQLEGRSSKKDSSGNVTPLQRKREAK